MWISDKNQIIISSGIPEPIGDLLTIQGYRWMKMKGRWSKSKIWHPANMWVKIEFNDLPELMKIALIAKSRTL